MTEVTEVDRAPYGRVVLAKLGRDEERVGRARRSLVLDHPAIARCLELVEVDDGFALLQELCAGVPIAQAVKSLDTAAVLDLVDQALAAFEHAHELGVAHGDLQPDDIVVAGGRVKVRRFGFARPSRPPAPRYDLLALGKLLAPLVGDPDVRDVLMSPLLDASTARRNLRRTPQREDSFVSTQAAHAEPAPRMDERLVGRQLGDFLIRGKLREGGLGMVFCATQLSLDREVVVKIPISRSGPIPDTVLKRFLAEARLASSLDHPYAAHIYAFGHEPDGVMWIAMELVDGTPLDDYLKQTGPMPAARAVAFVERLCQVVHNAHELRIVHRDIKPGNVMVMQRSGRLLPKLLDFGIARVVDEPATEVTTTKTNDDLRLTQEGSAMGSPLYMSPEQWDDASKVGPASDIYALGVLTYELLAARPPFKAGSIAGVADAHIHAQVPSLGPGFAPELDAVIARAMAKNPADRFATALELGRALMTAAGIVEEASPLPRLPETVRAGVLASGPPPIAACVAVLENARNVHQARSALEETVDAVANWLGAIALLARSRIGPGSGDRTHALALVRALGDRLLEPTEWLALARELCAPYFQQPAVHPLAELVLWVRDRSDLLQRLLDRRTDIVDEATARTALVDDVTSLADLLASLAFLHHLRIVLPHEPRTADIAPGTITITRPAVPRPQPRPSESRSCEVWSGTHREIRTLAALGAMGDASDVVYVDADGAPVLKLAPLVQRAPSIPGQPDALFVFAGHARLVAAPHGFALSNAAIHDWLRTNILDDHGTPDAATAGERSPFRGLASFTADDADLFFGREKEQASCVNRLLVQPLVAVVGRSGAGKSSFVHAGVIPVLPEGWTHVSMRPGSSPLAALRARAGDLVPAAIADNELAAALITAARRTTIVLAIDQFEELFTLCSDAAERAQFADLLARFAVEDSGVRVILTLRDDFLIPAEQLLAGRIGPHLMLLTTPAPADLERILREPVARLGYAFDDGLVARMVADVADQPGALALLSFAADQLWQRRDRHFKRLTTSAYEAMNGVAGALIGHAERLVGTLSASEVTLVRDVFRRLVTAEGTRAVVPRREILEVLGHRAAIIERLVESRLVVTSEGVDGEEQLEVAHETLLQTWPRLVQWRGEDAEGARMREQLRIAAKQWDARERPDGLLWRGDALTEYRLWRQRHPDALTAAETAFADASVKLERRAITRRRLALGAAFVALATFSIVAFTLRQQAVAAHDETQRRLIASYIAQARTKLQDGRRWEALASVIAAEKLGATGPIVETIRGLARAPARALEFRIDANAGRTWSTRYSPDGKRLVSAGDDGAALWDAATGALVARLADAGASRDAVFAPDGAVATLGFDGLVHLYTADGRIDRTWRAHDRTVRCAGWWPDGRWFATTGDDGFVRIWDAKTGALARKFEAEGHARVTSCAFNSKLLAVGTDAGQVALVDPETGTADTLGRHGAWARALQFDATGARLVSASHDQTVRVWDVAGKKQLAELRGAGDWVLDVALSPDGTSVAAAVRDARVIVWDIATGALRMSLLGHKGTVWHVEYSSDGTQILSSADDGSARSWEARTGALLTVFEGHDAAVIAARFSPDNAHVVTASYDGSVVAWQRTPSHFLGTLPPDPTTDCVVNNSADGHWVAVACPSRTSVWSIAEHRIVAQLPGTRLAVATDKHAFLVAQRDAQLWDWKEGRMLAKFELPWVPSVIGASPSSLAVESAGKLQLFDLAGHAIATPAPGPVDSIALLPGGPWLAIGHDNNITGGGANVRRGSAFAIIGFKDLYLVHDSAAPIALAGHHGITWTAAFDASGEHLVSTSEDGGGIVWDVARHAIRARLVSGSLFFAGASFDDSGHVMITLDGSGSLQLFDAGTGDAIATLAGKLRRPTYLARAADGTLLAFGRTGEIAMWRVDRDVDPLAAAERDLACKAPANERVGTCTR